MHRSILSVNLFLLTLSFGQVQAVEIDPVSVSSNLYKVLLENEHVRVVEYQINPGERDDWHTHPAKVSYVLTGGSLKITTESGESFVVEEEENSAGWFGAVGKHFAENVGKTPVRIVFVEIKEIEKTIDDLQRFKKDEP
ncbi:MAG: quercetin dioxygenase-like cupin family protein [Gammaproteobacteria bacterium]|jgi:quercetin dioxygenase-like cupin family protein